jgi:hypothetical protein
VHRAEVSMEISILFGDDDDDDDYYFRPVGPPKGYKDVLS